MALDTLVHDQLGIYSYDYSLQQDKNFCAYLQAGTNDFYQPRDQNCLAAGNETGYCSSSWEMHSAYEMKDRWCNISSPEDHCISGGAGSVSGCNLVMKSVQAAAAVIKVGRRKRRRTKSGKNKEDMENQRMIHIMVERNRRKQMNQYLAVIRSLMPSSYVHRGDQASIVGGAINFVKELEHQLQVLEMIHQPCCYTINSNCYSTLIPAFAAEFFTSPQISTDINNPPPLAAAAAVAAMAKIEVRVVENHANLKILSKKRHRQLLKMVAGLQCLWFTILDLNVTTLDHMTMLYTFSLKVEDGCQLSTGGEIANAVNRILGSIENEAITLTT